MTDRIKIIEHQISRIIKLIAIITDRVVKLGEDISLDECIEAGIKIVALSMKMHRLNNERLRLLTGPVPKFPPGSIAIVGPANLYREYLDEAIIHNLTKHSLPIIPVGWNKDKDHFLLDLGKTNPSALTFQHPPFNVVDMDGDMMMGPMEDLRRQLLKGDWRARPLDHSISLPLQITSVVPDTNPKEFSVTFDRKAWRNLIKYNRKKKRDIRIRLTGPVTHIKHPKQFKRYEKKKKRKNSVRR